MTRILPVLLLAFACGGASVEAVTGDDVTVAATIGPQSVTHGALTASRPSIAYSFNGKAGDAIAPDVWPTGKSALTPSAAAVATLQAHADSPHPWTDAEIDALVADMRQQVDPRVAISSGQYLLSALQQQTATDAQRARAKNAVAQIIGTPEHFAKL